jgi:hypothetical protein
MFENNILTDERIVSGNSCSDIHTYNCPAPTTETDTREDSCPAGQEGAIIVSLERETTYDANCDPVVGSWTEVSTNNTCSPICTSRTETRSRTEDCASGYDGTVSIQEERIVYDGANCTTPEGSWNETSRNESCTPVCTARTETRQRSENCSAGYNGTISINESRIVYDGPYCTQAEGSWNEISRNDTCTEPECEIYYENRRVFIDSGRYGYWDTRRVRVGDNGHCPIQSDPFDYGGGMSDSNPGVSDAGDGTGGGDYGGGAGSDGGGDGGGGNR